MRKLISLVLVSTLTLVGLNVTPAFAEDAGGEQQAQAASPPEPKPEPAPAPAEDKAKQDTAKQETPKEDSPKADKAEPPAPSAESKSQSETKPDSPAPAPEPEAASQAQPEAQPPAPTPADSDSKAATPAPAPAPEPVPPTEQSTKLIAPELGPLTAPAPAGQTTSAPTQKKVYVCKYSATPGAGEKLQTFNQVSWNATETGWDGHTFPWWFGDKQGHSVALGFVGPGHTVYTKADCPPGIPAPKEVITYTDWVGNWQCGDLTVTETRTKTVQIVPYTVAFVNGKWEVVLDWNNAGTPTTTTETRTRALTAEELSRCEVAAPTLTITPQTCLVGDLGVAVLTPGKITITASASITIKVAQAATPGTEVANRLALSPGAYIVTATVTSGVFANLPVGWSFDGPSHTKIVFAFSIAAAEDCSVPKPHKDPTFTPWVDGQYGCGDTTVDQTRTRTDYTYTWSDGQWVQHTTETVLHQSRSLTQQELAALAERCAAPTVTVQPQTCVVGDQGVADYTGGSLTITGAGSGVTIDVYNSSLVKVTDLTDLAPGTYTVIATVPDGGFVPKPIGWDYGDSTSMIVRTFTVTAAADCSVPKPHHDPSFTPWLDGQYTCGDTTVDQTRTRTDYTYTWSDGQWVQHTTDTVQHQSRALTPEELSALVQQCAAPTVTVEPQTCVVGDQGVADYTGGSITISGAGSGVTVKVYNSSDALVSDLTDLAPDGYTVIATLASGSFTPLPAGWAYVGENTDVISRTVTVETAADCSVPMPEKDPSFTDWVDGQFTCGDTTVDQTRTRTDYTYTWSDGQWVEHSTDTLQHQTRELTEEELGALVRQCAAPTVTVAPQTCAVGDQGVADYTGGWIAITGAGSNVSVLVYDSSDFLVSDITDLAPGTYRVVAALTVPGSFAPLPDGWSYVGESTGTISQFVTVTAAEDCSIPKPEKDPSFTDWLDGEWQCGDTTVTQTRIRTDYTYTWEDGGWVEHTADTVESQPRELTLRELATCATPPTIAVVAQQCVVGDQGVSVFTPGSLTVTGLGEGVTFTVYDAADAEVTDLTNLAPGSYRVVAQFSGTFYNLPEGWEFNGETRSSIRFALAIAAASECGVPMPLIPTPTFSAWVDGQWVCGDTTVQQTRNRVDFGWTWNSETQSWTPTAVGTQETQTRPLTQAELGVCPLSAGGIEAVCVTNVPYLQYDVALPPGFVADSANPLTITFVHPSDSSQNVVWTNMPLAGARIWPGASDGDPQMWPGWALDSQGNYVEVGDGNYGWTRNGVTVTFEVNPSYSTQVAYPAASSACADPEVAPATEPNEPDEELAFTGVSDATDSLAALAVSLLVIGAVGRAISRRK